MHFGGKEKETSEWIDGRGWWAKEIEESEEEKEDRGRGDEARKAEDTGEEEKRRKRCVIIKLDRVKGKGGKEVIKRAMESAGKELNLDLEFKEVAVVGGNYRTVVVKMELGSESEKERVLWKRRI